MTEYRTVLAPAQAELVERKSRFIGYAKPVETPREADAFLAQVRAEHRTATHHVYAYIVRRNQFQRYSDDGEPQGTAGIPVLTVLQKKRLTDTAVVVTRYFGGVLLGAGGLVRAYSAAAAAAVDLAKVVTMRACVSAWVESDYSRYGKIAALVSACGGTVEDTVFTEQVRVRFYIPQADFAALAGEIAEATNGQARVVCEETKFVAIPEDSF